MRRRHLTQEVRLTERRRLNAESQRLRRQRDRDSLNEIRRTTAIQQDYLGEMNVKCIHCDALHFKSEKVSNKGLSFNDCCSHGTVKLEPTPIFPNELLNLFNGAHEKSNDFFKHIRHYNNLFSFASFNANLVNFGSRRSGPYCFKIQGQIYYQINTSLYPGEHEVPSYGQLFFVDQDEAMNVRMGQNSHLDQTTIEMLDRIIRENNIFAQSYRMMREEINQQRLINNDQNEPELQLLFSLKPGVDRRRYNFQRTNEVAAIFSTTADGEIPESYVTIRNRNTRCLQCVPSMNSNVEPWIYPLLYPFGTQGWHSNLECVNNRNNDRNRRVTRLAYTKHKIAVRSDEFNPIILSRRLFQQWLVDAYVKIEKDRIRWCKDHQREIKADTYQGLHDYLQNSANDIGGQVGKTVILPSTFLGSPRHMQQCYQDSMAIVNETGKPDIFLTMTCNPRWPEILENLLPGQQPCDRPDLVARVFHLKKDGLLDMIVKKKFFGDVASYVYVIEFQKRGLPHMHLLITLKHAYKIVIPETVDKFISAEIPDATKNTRLHDIVMKNMIHGPCGDWCMVDGKCSKKFPKSYQNETVMDENGYPYYMRKNDGIVYNMLNGHTVDNRWTVPYCPKLLETFNCHMNVEIVTSIRSVKYMYKYVYKGHDAANVVIGECDNNDRIINHDEIHDFIESRYVGPSEACYRILSKPLQDKSHSIIRLPVHLPKEHSVVISNDANNIEVHLEQASSMLLDYFKLNIEDEDARQYLYKDIPRFYTYKKEKCNGIMVSKWATRKKHFQCIGRMYSISPTRLELFHLRLILLHIKGATSFDSLKTVNGIVHPSFTAACLALGLIEDDEEWVRAMEEAVVWMMPRRLRQLFVRILIHCQPVHPEELWDKFKDAMSEDFSRTNEALLSHQIAYAHINNLLNKEGRNLSDFPSMEQSVIETEVNNEMSNESLAQFSVIGQQQYERLNAQQKEIVDIVLCAVDSDSGENNCIYVDGPGGSGKTFIYTTLYKLLLSKHVKVCTMAFTGIAAILLPNGRTVHKTFGLPVPMFYDSSSNIKVQSKEGIFLKETKVFIWDEAPMAPRYALEIVNRSLKCIMGNDLPFGGKIMILGGDFRQLLPIKMGGTRSETLNLSIKFSELWRHFKKYSLTANMRVRPNEVEFAKFLLEVGDGVLNDENDNINLPENCILESNCSVVQIIFGKLIEEMKFKEMSSCAILSARNIDVDELNKQVTDLLDASTEHIYSGIDSTDNCDNGELDEILLPEYLNSLNPPSLPPYELRLRKNCIIMLIRNISINEGLCNGTRLQIVDFSNHLLKCQILTGDKSNDIVFLNRITLYSSNEYPFTFKRRQFPIKLAFAMTINKSQGQTFDKIGIDLRRDVFNHGQLYVAMSRVRSWDSLKFYLGDQRGKVKVKNYVYKELYL